MAGSVILNLIQDLADPSAYARDDKIREVKAPTESNKATLVVH